MSSSALRASAILGTLFFLVRYWANKRRRGRIVSDFARVARRVEGESGGTCGNDEYDVVIIGGGTAGCVLASRVSEDPSIRVLLLEAGQTSLDKPYAIIPSAYGRFFHGPHDWDLYTEPQDAANGRKLYWPRAKLLGGCSTMNAMMFHYGAPSDYDEWAELQKDQNGALDWSYKQIHPYFNKFEKYNPNDKFPDVDMTLRGTKGPVNVGYHGYFSELSRSFIDSCVAVGIERSHDINTHKGTLGVTKMMTYINSKGRRESAESAYLTPDVLARPNLTVATGATVTRVLFEKTPDGSRASGVEFVNKQRVTFRVKALKEVVLSAGAVHSPHILMLSGVGPASHLSSLGIPVVADLPGVGANLKDHIVVDLFYQDRHKTSLSYLRPQTFLHSLLLVKALAQYKLTGGGPLTTNVGEAAAFFRTLDKSLFPPEEYSQETAPEDTTSGESAPDIEVFIAPVAYNNHGCTPPPKPGYYTFSLHAALLRPKSSGTIRLKSKSPFDPPVIDPNYLADKNDVTTFIRSIRLMHQIAHSEPLASHLDPTLESDPALHHNIGLKSDAELDSFVRKSIMTLYHPCCSTRMAPIEDNGVVDPYLRVHGISNLRIADAGVFPSIVSGHTAAPVLAIAEKASDLIRKDCGSGK